MNKGCLLGWMLVLILTAVGAAQASEMLRYAGATTLQRYFMPEAARIFNDETEFRINIEGGNTGPGIAALLKGTIDMAGAGRRLTEDERQKGLVEHFIGWDVLVIVVNQSNPVTDLSVAQLQGIFSGEIDNWKQVGGPDLPILVITSPQGSGMRSAVKSLILKEKDYLKREVISAIVAQADQQVSFLPNAITALSKSMVDKPNVMVIKVDGVEPTPDNLANDLYPLAKPLALVTRGEPTGALARFIALARGPRGQNILKRHFVPRFP